MSGGPGTGKDNGAGIHAGRRRKHPAVLKKNNRYVFCISGCFIDTGFERISVNIMTTRETKVSKKRKAREMNYENA